MPRSNRTPTKTKSARRLRRDGTDVERRLWQRSQNGQLGDAQFRRQHPAGRYVLDFFCPALALAVELDGGQHAHAGTRDRERDGWLKQKGVTVLRFWNSDVTENLDGVLEAIAAKISELRSAATRSRERWTPTPTFPLSGGGSAPPELRHGLPRHDDSWK
jgi:very-short-patch-repair endonuclease